MTLSEDTILENRYRIDQLLSQGGMGAVYKAFDTKLEIPVAIKENFFQTPQSIRQFEQEAFILARLRHSGLPRVTDHFSYEGQQYLVMDFIEGQDLWRLVKQQGHSLAEGQALEYIIQVCEAVNYLHERKPPIIHRDIKPQNIKITPRGRAVLVDFGIAKVGGQDTRTSTGAQGVTPGFSPPEQYSGTGTTPASDIYALGATLYAVLTFQKPPDSITWLTSRVGFKPPSELNAKLSEQVSQAIMHAMQPRPEDRPQSVAAWQQELKAIGEAPTLPQPDETKTVRVPAVMFPVPPAMDRTRVSETQPPSVSPSPPKPALTLVSPIKLAGSKISPASSGQPTKLMGMPDAQLIVVESPALELEQGRVFKIVKAETTIGRDAGDQVNDIDLLHKSVSRQHAVIKFDGQDFIIYDIKAVFRTKVNGQEVGKIEGIVLNDGAELQFGPKTILRFKKDNPNVTRMDDPNLTMLDEDDPDMTKYE